MAIALPIAVRGELAGTGFIAGLNNNNLAVVTALHILGNGLNLEIILPPHMGDISRPQTYPIEYVTSLKAELVIAEHLFDIAILVVKEIDVRTPVPRFISDARDIRIGEEVLVVGYPYSVIGSILETAEPSVVSALGHRQVLPNFAANEFILSKQTHPGSSGSPVVRRRDGVVCGVLRGCLAPPGMLSIGNIPLGTDSSVTYVTSAHIIPSLIKDALQMQ